MAAKNDAIGRRFQLLGGLLEGKEKAQAQQEKEGLKRRFAAIGGLGSGASIKSEQLAQQASSRRLGEGRTQLAVEEAGQRQRQQEIEEGRAFQTSERLGAQEFAAGEAGKQRGFLTGERLGAQKFQAGETALGRALQREGMAQQQSQFERTATEAERAARTIEEHEATQIHEAMRQAQVRERHDAARINEAMRQFDVRMNQSANIHNETMAFKQALAEWEQQFRAEEFDFNKYVTGENLATARAEARAGSRGIFGDLFGVSPSFGTSSFFSGLA